MTDCSAKVYSASIPITLGNIRALVLNRYVDFIEWKDSGFSAQQGLPLSVPCLVEVNNQFYIYIPPPIQPLTPYIIKSLITNNLINPLVDLNIEQQSTQNKKEILQIITTLEKSVLFQLPALDKVWLLLSLNASEKDFSFLGYLGVNNLKTENSIRGTLIFYYPIIWPSGFTIFYADNLGEQSLDQFFQKHIPNSFYVVIQCERPFIYPPWLHEYLQDMFYLLEPPILFPS